jgi:hypothetical protein
MPTLFKKAAAAALCAALAAALLAGCSLAGRARDGLDAQARVAAGAGSEFPGDYAVAVVRTSDHHEGSYLELYDEELRRVATVAYPYTCLENMPNNAPFRCGDEVLIAHRGYLAGRGGGQVVSINALTGEARAYDVGRSFVSNAAALGDSIFASGGNRPGFVVELNRQGQTIAVAEEDGMNIIGFTELDGALAACSYPADSYADDGSISIFSTADDVGNFIRLNGLGTSHILSREDNGKVYFGAIRQYIDNKSEEYAMSCSVASLRVRDGEVRKLISTDNEIESVAVDDTSVYALQQDIDNPENSCVYVIDKTTEELRNRVSLGIIPEQMGVYEGRLYVFGMYKETGKLCLRQYRIDGTDLKDMRETAMDESINALDRYFASGMFFRNSAA